MADRADSTYSRRDPRHFVEWPPLGKLLKATDLRHVELRACHHSGVIQLDGHLRVPFNARYWLYRDPLHAVLLIRTSPQASPACGRPTGPSTPSQLISTVADTPADTYPPLQTLALASPASAAEARDLPVPPDFPARHPRRSP